MLLMKSLRRFLIRHLCSVIFVILCACFIFLYYGKSPEPLIINRSTTTVVLTTSCHFKPSTDEFLRQYQGQTIHGTQPDSSRAEPTVERLRKLFEILHSKEGKYQALLDTLDVFDMSKPMTSFKAYTDQSNIDEIKNLYNRFVKLTTGNGTVEIDPSLIEYLKKISGYLSDGLREQRTKKVNGPWRYLPMDYYFVFRNLV